MRIRISLPDDRDYEGWLEVLDASGAVVFGPVPATGRADDELAAAHGNASRSPLRAYGDTPLGGYSVRGVLELGSGTAHDGRAHDTRGVVLLEPASGEAALADAHGRFRVYIQGGDDDDGRLRATAGAVRLHDRDLKRLLALVRRASGRVRCDVVTTAERGTKVSCARVPLDTDPPALPGRLENPTAPSPRPEVVRAAGYAPRMFVVPEHSGSSGGTGYGGSSGGTGGDADAGASVPVDASISALPVAGTDWAPTPGADLNPPPDQTGLSSAAPLGISASATYSPEQGWIISQQPPPFDPYTNTPFSPFTGTDGNAYSGSPAPSANAYTGGHAVDPATGSGATNTTPAGGTQGTYASYGPQRDSVDNQDAQIQAMVARFAQDDADLLAKQAAQAQSNVGQNYTRSTSPAPQNYTPSVSPWQNFSPASPQPDASISQSYPDGSLSTQTLTDQASLTTAATVGSVASQGYLPAFESQGVGAFSRSPTAGIGPGQWRGFLGETSFNANSPLGGAFNTDLNTRPFTTASGAAGNPGFFPALDFQNAITGDGTSVATSLRADPQARLNWYDAKYRESIGSLNPNKLNTAAQNLGVAPGDLAENNRLAINADNVRAAQDYISENIRNNPGNYPPGWDPDAPYRQIVSNGLTSANLQALQNARFGLANLSPEQIQTLMSPENLSVIRNGWGGTLGNSALSGGAQGGGIAAAFDLAQILANPEAHPDAARELATTYVAGYGAGVTGSVIETGFNAAWSQSALASAVPGAESSALTPLFGRVLGGGLGGGPAAGVFTAIQMAASDQQYSTEDYEAKITRSAVDGAAGGALAAGVVGAIWGSEVPIAGNILGFAIGVGGYYLADWLFGDSVESSIRSHPTVDENAPPPGVPDGYIWTQGVGVPDYSWLEN